LFNDSLTSVSLAKRRRVRLPHFQRGVIYVSISGSGDAAEAAETRDEAGTTASHDCA